MHPQVDIRKVRERYFNYSVSTGSADERHLREGLRSIAECLHDAATALSDHFSATYGPEGLRYALMIVMGLLLPTALLMFSAGSKIQADIED